MFPSVVTATHTHTQDEMACHLHPIICTWDAVTTCTPVTIFFPTWGVVMLEKKIPPPPPPQKKKKTLIKLPQKQCGRQTQSVVVKVTTYHGVR